MRRVFLAMALVGAVGLMSLWPAAAQARWRLFRGYSGGYYYPASSYANYYPSYGTSYYPSTVTYYYPSYGTYYVSYPSGQTYYPTATGQNVSAVRTYSSPARVVSYSYYYYPRDTSSYTEPYWPSNAGGGSSRGYYYSSTGRFSQFPSSTDEDGVLD